MRALLFVALLVGAPVLGAPLDAPLAQSLEPAPWPVEPRSVYRIDPWIDAPLLVAGGLGAIVPFALDAQLIRPRCPCDTSEVWGFERGVIGLRSRGARIASDVTIALAISVPVVLDAFDVGFSWPLLEDMVVYLEVLAFNNALVNLGKYTAQRPRPFVYAGIDPTEAAKPDAYASFYSGHAANVFSVLVAASTTYTLRHGPKWWPWLITALVGTSVAIERVFAGQHFPTDFVVGAAAGAAVGWLIPWLHARARGAVSVAPVPHGGAVLVWSGRL